MIGLYHSGFAGVSRWCLGIAAAVLLAGAGTAEAAGLPSFERVEEVVDRHFATLADHQAGDLICRSDVLPLFDQLRILGWRVVERNQILRNTLDDNDFLVEEFRTRQGHKFMREIAGYPVVYDRLDRLTVMPGGKQLITGMIGLPNGSDLLKEHPTPGLKSLTQLLPKGVSGRTPNDPDFWKRTGRIYTVEDLLAALKQAHERAASTVR